MNPKLIAEALNAVADGLLKLAVAVNEAEAPAEESRPAKKKTKKKAGKKTAKKVEKKEEEQPSIFDTDPEAVADDVDDAEEPPFKNADEIIAWCQKLIEEGKANFKDVAKLNEYFGVQTLRELDKGLYADAKQILETGEYPEGEE